MVRDRRCGNGGQVEVDVIGQVHHRRRIGGRRILDPQRAVITKGKAHARVDAPRKSLIAVRTRQRKPHARLGSSRRSRRDAPHAFGEPVRAAVKAVRAVVGSGRRDRRVGSARWRCVSRNSDRFAGALPRHRPCHSLHRSRTRIAVIAAPSGESSTRSPCALEITRVFGVLGEDPRDLLAAARDSCGRRRCHLGCGVAGTFGAAEQPGRAHAQMLGSPSRA